MVNIASIILAYHDRLDGDLKFHLFYRLSSLFDNRPDWHTVNGAHHLSIWDPSGGEFAVLERKPLSVPTNMTARLTNLFGSHLSGAPCLSMSDCRRDPKWDPSLISECITSSLGGGSISASHGRTGTLVARAVSEAQPCMKCRTRRQPGSQILKVPGCPKSRGTSSR